MANQTSACQICKKKFRQHEILPAHAIRQTIVNLIRKSQEWSENGYICHNDLKHFRKKYIESVLETEKGELSKLEKEVVKSLTEHEILVKSINKEFEKKLSLGESLADKVAGFGGSWKFIMLFLAIIMIWIVDNSFLLLSRPFDPYPFILLNLVLSCVAALQAPVIMMSQNRKEQKDRLRGEHDYKIDLKAELEIRHLHEKLDHLLQNQWHHLMDVQELQVELLEELSGKRKNR